MHSIVSDNTTKFLHTIFQEAVTKGFAPELFREKSMVTDPIERLPYGVEIFEAHVEPQAAEGGITLPEHAIDQFIITLSEQWRNFEQLQALGGAAYTQVSGTSERVATLTLQRMGYKLNG